MFEGKSSTVFQHIIVALAVFAVLLSGCQPKPTPTATPPPPNVTLAVNPDITDVPAGDTVALTVEASGQDLRFKWSAGRGKLSAFDTPAVLYTAPDSAGVDTVAVEVSSASGTTTRNVSFNVIAPPTATFTPAPALTSTPTATSTPAPTSTATPTSTPTATPSPIPSPIITITTPLAEVKCPLDDECRFSIKGTSSGVASDPDLKVIVFIGPGWSNEWWPHMASSVNSDGTWQGHAQIGDRPCWPTGDSFEIVAMVLTHDQVDGIAIDFQPLPDEYVARSNRVDLVTTYDPVPIHLSLAKPSYDDTGSNIITLIAWEQSHLAFDYDLGTGGWVQVTVPVNLDMFCMKEVGFSIAFSLEGTGAANSFEVKLEDADYTSYGWRRPRGSVTADLEMIDLSLDIFRFWWDGDNQDTDMNWQQVMNILFAVSQHPGDEGGEGQVTISDVVLIPPATP